MTDTIVRRHFGDRARRRSVQATTPVEPSPLAAESPTPPTETAEVTAPVAKTPVERYRMKATKAKPVKKQKRAKENSTIAFPYMDLDTAITVARAFVNNGGHPHTRDQLAGALQQSPLSGAFIMKLSAARQFGLVDYLDGKFKLTDLGFSIVDKSESREKAARVQAFLSVELYRKIYENFKGKQLPARPLGIEQTLVQMGVAPKQKSSARLAFEKSARQAGFLTLDPDRLIEPMSDWSPDPTATVLPGKTANRPTFFGSGGSYGLDPLIEGLLSRLPPPGEIWSTDKRKKWLETLEANFEMIYPAGVDGKPEGDSNV
jgi:hypothetical protein